MAVTTSMVLSGLSAVSGLVGGLQQQSEAKQQAEYAQAQGISQAKENVRIAAKEAGIEKREAESVRRQQKLAYLKSGVSLEGSPLLMMEKTRLQGQQNVDEIIASGGAASSAALTEGRMQAKNYKASGRQAFVGGLGKAFSVGASLFD